MNLVKQIAGTAFLLALVSPSFANDGVPQILNGMASSNAGVQHLSDADQQSLRGQRFSGANRHSNAGNWCRGRGHCYTYTSGGDVIAVDPYRDGWRYKVRTKAL